MKYILAIGLMFAVTANAGGYKPESNGANALSNSNSSSVSVSGAVSGSESTSTSVSNASTGSSNSNTSVNIENDSERVPVSTASGSFSNTTAECRYLQSNSVQLLVFGTSNTSMLLDLVCVLKNPLTEEQKLALCLSNSDYRKIRKHLNNECEVK